MGKIGDLFVRLGLKSDGFKKGIQEAKNETQDFGSKLGKLKAGALAVWAAIGAGVVKVAKDMISATNEMGDAWAQQMASIKASYNSLITEVTSKSKNEKGWWLRLFNLSDPKAAQQLGANAKKAGEAAAEMTKAFDAEFELTNSIRLQRLQIQQELNELYTKMRDTTLSNADRQAAADRYKALLQPIADAEVAVYGNMLSEAVKAWQAGMELDRVYSTDEMVEFFSKIGTEYDKMAQKFPDLMRVYETRKGDATNLPIFDTIAKLQQASNQMSDVDRVLSRTTNSIKANVQREIEAIAKAVSEYGSEDVKLDLSVDLELEVDEEEITENMAAVDEYIQQFADNWRSQCEDIKAQNEMLEQSFIGSMSGGLQAVTDMLFGIEGAGVEQVLAALLQPFAQTATQLGEMLLAQGMAISAFKTSLKSLNPAVAIAAGTALIAVGAVLSSGIQALGGGAKGTTAATTAGGAGSTGGGAGGIETYDQELTVHVVGEIAGDKIVLAGQNTMNKWKR
jgi:hypothetical protein